jgi:hypothetical protein
MPSKIVIDKKDNTNYVTEFAKTNAGPIAAAIVKRQKEKLPQGTDLVTYELSIVALQKTEAAILDDNTHKMLDADEAYLVETGDDAEPRQKRDDATKALRQVVVELRETLTGVYGAKALRGLGFSTDTPEDSSLLSGFTKEIIRSFESKQSSGGLPTVREGTSFNPGPTLTKLGNLRNALETHLKAVTKEERELQTALSVKNKAIAEYDKTFSRVARLFETLCLLAGMDDLAKKVRPSRRNPGQLAEEGEVIEDDTEPTEEKKV